MALFSDMLPMDVIVGEIKKAIAKHEENPSDETIRGMVMWTALLNTKHITMNTKGGVREVVKDLDEIKKMKDLITRTDQ